MLKVFFIKLSVYTQKANSLFLLYKKYFLLCYFEKHINW